MLHTFGKLERVLQNLASQHAQYQLKCLQADNKGIDNLIFKYLNNWSNMPFQMNNFLYESYTNKIMHKLLLLFILVCLANSGPAAVSCAAFCIFAGPGFASCYATCLALHAPLFCFSEETTVMTRTGIKTISELKLGEQVLTLNTNNTEEWTAAIFKQRSNASGFIRIETDSHILEVTPEHIMIVGGKLMRAQNLQIGMMIQHHRITKLSSVSKQRKVTLATRSGTVLANGLLTTTICADYLELDIETALKKWREDHIRFEEN